MIRFIKRTMGNEEGVVLVVALLLLAVITVIGIAATRTSQTELQVTSNEREISNDFYRAEGALIDKVERPATWLTISFITGGETTAHYTDDTVDIDSDGNADATVEVRCIENTGTSVGDLSAAANDLPLQPHVGPPPPGGPYSLKHFEVRRYGATATSATGNTQIQVGVYKAFNKF
jgi:hypothetical protein